MKLALLILLVCAIALMGQTKATGTFNFSDLFRVGQLIYMCGQTEGVRRTFAQVGRDDLAKQAKNLWDESGCADMMTLIHLGDKP